MPIYQMNVYHILLLMEADRPFVLTLLHFNDAYNIDTNKHKELGFINFYDYLQQKRKMYPQSLLIFSGDCFAPSKLSKVLKGEQMAYCINKLGIDVACYGNHDFDFPPEHVQKLVKDCKFPWLMGNIKYLDTGKNIGDGLSYYIKEHLGIKIGFLGLGGPDFIGRLISKYKNKLKYIEVKEYAKQISQKLREDGCELIIALTHCRNPIDQSIARAVPEIDIILGGHDHHRILSQVNKTPIIKSGADFQFLSVIHLRKPGQIKLQTKQATVLEGRRWVVEHICHKVPKAVNYYPDLQAFIQQAVEKRIQYQDKKKEKEQAIKAKQLPPIEVIKEDQLIEYGMLNNRKTVTLKAGLSAEICFAKFIAFKRKLFYIGYKRAAPSIQPDFVHNMLEYVYNEIQSHQNCGKTVLYSPGICNVPYLVETANLVYLPSHFLVGVSSIEALGKTLNSAIERGYKCYAVLGYDPFFKKQLCAWIKFTQPPLEYIKLIDQLQIQNVIMMSVHDMKGENHGAERNCRLIRGGKKEKKYPEPGDIYVNFIRQDDEKSKNKQIEIFGRLILDRPKTFWKQLLEEPRCSYMHDWESGIDCIDYLQNSFRAQLPQQKIRYYKIVHPNSWNLYLTAYHLAKAFIQYNYDPKTHNVVPKGLVLNQYIMSSPTYEMNYGYVPILYWQFYSANQKRIISVLTPEEKGYKRWLNMHKGTHLRMVAKDSLVINTDYQGIELGKWITKYAPLQYSLKYLPIELFLSVLQKLNLLVDCN